MRFLGLGLAWGLGGTDRPVRRSGVVSLGERGAITDAGWTTGIDQTLCWAGAAAGDDAVLLVDAPLLVLNGTGAARLRARGQPALPRHAAVGPPHQPRLATFGRESAARGARTARRPGLAESGLRRATS